tara:strand:+ start:180 stop:362 length:183 start_codon:yes stop_codon:yes gene_type:complete
MENSEIVKEINEIVKLASNWLPAMQIKELADNLEQSALDHIQRNADYKQRKLSALLNKDS